jgi:hypothetical protein
MLTGAALLSVESAMIVTSTLPASGWQIGVMAVGAVSFVGVLRVAGRYRR